ncbi:MAG: hypothetical protein AAGA80_01155 [Cyanobacteria bacterium P01_F01_bin.143]
MIIVISNRNVNQQSNDESLFGEHFNDQGSDKIRIAKAEYTEATDKWALELIPEDNGANLPSQKLFEEIATGISQGIYKRDWIFYIPGYDQSSRKALDNARAISQKYEVEIVLFSWPSNPGGFLLDEYPSAIEAGKISANALRQAFIKLDSYRRNCPLDDIEQRRISFNLLNQSLGNVVAESYARLLVSNEVSEIFDNIIFHQADIDNKDHAEWIDKIDFGKRIYVTININDEVLTVSGGFHANRLNARNVNNRLGNTTKELTAKKPIYVDFTNGVFVSTSHNLFLLVDNAIVETFFKQLFKGQQGEIYRPFEFDSNLNAYVLDQD